MKNMIEKWPKNEALDLQKEKESITQVLEKIKSSGIFDDTYLNELMYVFFSENGSVGRFKSGEIYKADFEEYDIQDFMQGKRTDFIGIHSKEEFEKNSNIDKLDDKQFLPFIFIEGKLSYNEFVAHEIAHNVFDKEYIKRYGNFNNESGVTNISIEYKEKIKLQIEELLKNYYPEFDMKKIVLNRQKIAEVYALSYEREYCRKTNENLEMHNKIKEKVDAFMLNSEKSLADFNAKYNRNCTMEDFYNENHILSIIVAPLLEEKYPEFKDRKEFFWK